MIEIIISFILGVIFGMYVLAFFLKKNASKYKTEVENIFRTILSNSKNITFQKRINKYVYFKYETWEIIFLLDKKSLNIFKKDECIATSTQVDNSLYVQELVKFIEFTWSDDINDIVTIDNNIYSRGFYESRVHIKKEDIVEEVYLNLDEILDKISSIGYDKLTDTEKTFLKNYSK